MGALGYHSAAPERKKNVSVLDTLIYLINHLDVHGIEWANMYEAEGRVRAQDARLNTQPCALEASKATHDT